MVLVEDTAEKDRRRAGHEVSLDPSQLGTAVYEAGCTCQCPNLAVLLCDASLSDTLEIWLLDTGIPVKTNNKNYVTTQYATNSTKREILALATPSTFVILKSKPTGRCCYLTNTAEA